MAGWNTPARNAAIAKRPCDRKTQWVFGHCWQRQNIGREDVARPTCGDLRRGCLRSSLTDVFCGSRADLLTTSAVRPERLRLRTQLAAAHIHIGLLATRAGRCQNATMRNHAKATGRSQ
jgi:hypothetical protein